MSDVSDETIRWAAEQIIRMHTVAPPHTIERGADVPRCARCLPDGQCPLLAWARAVIESPDEG